jgi:uncharacterized protein YyaL (SSP411 family)
MTPFLVLVFAVAADAGPDRALYDQLCAQVAASYDSSRGGFVAGDVPHSGAVELALALARDGDLDWGQRALLTMDWTWALYDSVGGGYYQAMSNTEKSATKFEKRTDSNSLRLENLIDAWHVTGDREYKIRGRQVIDYFDRVLMDGRGGFVQGQYGGQLMFGQANGYAIHAWLRWAGLTEDKRRIRFAQVSLDRVWEISWVDDLGLMRRDELNDIMMTPRLVDQVEFGRASLLSAQLSGRRLDLERAIILGRMVVERYQDPETKGFYFQAVPNDKGGVKKAKRHMDENARAALFLCELSAYTGDGRYREAARAAWLSFGDKLEKLDLDAADWALAIRASFAPAGTAFSTPSPEATSP